MPLTSKGASFILLTLFMFVSLNACRKSHPSFEDLNGEWTILEAKRNGRITLTLEKVYFSFDSSSSMQTNFLGEDVNYPVSFNYPGIEVESSLMNKLNVISLVEDTLKLSTRIDKFKFELELLKVKDSSNLK